MMTSTPVTILYSVWVLRAFFVFLAAEKVVIA